MLCFCLVLPINAKASSPTEAELKAILIYKVARFVRWPDEDGARDDFPLCVVGREETLNYLSSLSVDSKVIRVVALKKPNEVSAADCALIYFPQSSQQQLPMWIAGLGAENNSIDALASARFTSGQVNNAPLMISEIAGSAAQGVMVEIARENNKLALRLNLKAAKRAGLSFATPLIQLSEVVD